MKIPMNLQNYRHSAKRRKYMDFNNVTLTRTEAMNLAEHASIKECVRLKSCQAWEIVPSSKLITEEGYGYNFDILQSYQTRVAMAIYGRGVYRVDSGGDVTVLVFDYYSVTTSQHISRWVKELKKWYNVTVVKMYNDSRTGKRKAKENIEKDFLTTVVKYN